MVESNATRKFSEGKPLGTILDCKVLKLYHELDFRGYIPNKKHGEIKDKLNYVLDIVQLYDNPNFSRHFLQYVFVSSQYIFEIFQKGYSLNILESTADALSEGLSRRAIKFLDETIAVAWADYSGMHSRLAQQLGILH